MIAALEAYEPARAITQAAIAHAAAAPVFTLRQELRSLESSPFVFNRALREAVLRVIEHRAPA